MDRVSSVAYEVMSLEFLIASAFPLHVSAMYFYRKYRLKTEDKLFDEELFNDDFIDLLTMSEMEEDLKDNNTFHKSDSEYSLGLNRSESLAFSLNQYGRPCFMDWSVSSVMKMLFIENKETLFVAGSFAFIYYHATSKVSEGGD